MVIDEPVRGSYAYLEQPGLLSLSGLEQFRPFMRGQVSLAPITRLSGLVVSEAALGMATFTMPASPWWQSAAGVFFGGTFAFVADAALGSAVYTSLPPGMGLATSELSMNFLRPATPASGTINARGRLIQAGRAQGLSEALIEDGQGRLLAHATSRLIVMKLPFDPMPPPDEFPPLDEPTYDTPDPYLRPLEGTVMPKEWWDRYTGLETLQQWVKGDCPNAPVTNLIGWRGVEVEEGAATFALPASEWFCTAYRGFYGGALAVLADGAIGAAVISTLPAGGSYATLDLKVNFIRPVNPDGRDLIARARVVHRGRTVAVVTADIEDADGKRVAMATGSSLLFEGRSWFREGETAAIDQSPGDD